MPRFNLLYNLCLICDNPILYFNISNLKKHIDKFNGKKIININYINYEAAKNFVKNNFSDKTIEFIFTHNNETKGQYEIYPFIHKMMPLIESKNEKEYTFYAHTKGVTKYKDPADFACILWAYVMYDKNLENLEYITDILKNYSCCGTLKVDKPIGPLNFVPWHYSGAFFWFKNSDIFNLEWKKYYNSVFGMEGYLGMHINSDKAFAIPPSLSDGHENPYSRDTWEFLSNQTSYTPHKKKLSYGFDSYI